MATYTETHGAGISYIYNEIYDTANRIKVLIEKYWNISDYWDPPFRGKFRIIPLYGLNDVTFDTRSGIIEKLSETVAKGPESKLFRKIFMLYVALHPWLCKFVFDPTIYYMFVVEDNLSNDDKQFYINIFEIALYNLYNHEIRGLNLDSYATFKIQSYVSNEALTMSRVMATQTRRRRAKERKAKGEDVDEDDEENKLDFMDVETEHMHKLDISKKWTFPSHYSDRQVYDESKDYHFTFSSGEREDVYYKKYILNECDNVDSFTYRSNDKIILYKMGDNTRFIYLSDLIRGDKDLHVYTEQDEYKGKCIRLDTLDLIRNQTKQLFNEPGYNLYRCKIVHYKKKHKMRSQGHTVSSVAEYEGTLSRLVILEKRQVIVPNLTKNYAFGRVDISKDICKSSDKFYSLEVPRITYTLHYDIVRRRLEDGLNIISLNDFDPDVIIGGRRLTAAIFNSVLLPTDDLRLYVSSSEMVDNIHRMLQSKTPPGDRLDRKDSTNNRRISIGNVAYPSTTFTIYKPEVKFRNEVKMQRVVKLTLTVIVYTAYFTGISCERVYLTKDSLYFSPSFLFTALSGGILLGNLELIDDPLDFLIEIEKYTSHGFTYIPKSAEIDTRNKMESFLTTPQNDTIISSILGDHFEYDCNLKYMNIRRYYMIEHLRGMQIYTNASDDESSGIVGFIRDDIPIWITSDLLKKKLERKSAERSMRVTVYKNMTEQLIYFFTSHPGSYTSSTDIRLLASERFRTMDDEKKRERPGDEDTAMGTMTALYEKRHKKDLIKSIYERIVREFGPKLKKPDESWIEIYMSWLEEDNDEHSQLENNRFFKLFKDYRDFLRDTLEEGNYLIQISQVIQLFQDAISFREDIRSFIHKILEGKAGSEQDINDYEAMSNPNPEEDYKKIINKFSWLDGVLVRYNVDTSIHIKELYDIKSYLTGLVKEYRSNRIKLAMDFQTLVAWVDDNPVHLPYIINHLRGINRYLNFGNKSEFIFYKLCDDIRYMYFNDNIFDCMQIFWFFGLYPLISDYIQVVCNHANTFYQTLISNARLISADYDDDEYNKLATKLEIDEDDRMDHISRMKAITSELSEESYHFATSSGIDFKVSTRNFSVTIEEDKGATVFNCPYYQSRYGGATGSFFILQNNESLRDAFEFHEAKSCFLLQMFGRVNICAYDEFLYLSRHDQFAVYNGNSGTTVMDRTRFIYPSLDKICISTISSSGNLEDTQRLPTVNALNRMFSYQMLCPISWIDEDYFEYFRKSFSSDLKSFELSDESNLKDVFCTRRIQPQYMPFVIPSGHRNIGSSSGLTFSSSVVPPSAAPPSSVAPPLANLSLPPPGDPLEILSFNPHPLPILPPLPPLPLPPPPPLPSRANYASPPRPFLPSTYSLSPYRSPSSHAQAPSLAFSPLNLPPYSPLQHLQSLQSPPPPPPPPPPPSAPSRQPPPPPGRRPPAQRGPSSRRLY